MLLKTEADRQKFLSLVVVINRQHLGQKEIRGNMGFFSNALNLLLKKWRLFRKGEPYCASYALSIWKESAQQLGFTDLLDEIEKLDSASTVTAFNNFDASELFDTTSHTRKNKVLAGSIVIWRKPKKWQGHAGTVTSGNAYNFTTIEGNTGGQNQREGDGIYQKTRGRSLGSMQIMGFITPKIEGEK